MSTDDMFARNKALQEQPVVIPADLAAAALGLEVSDAMQ